MTTQEVMLNLNDYITFSGALPIKLNDKELENIIKNAADYFYTNWRYALEPAVLFLTPPMFLTDEFRKFRQIRLADSFGNSCIRYVEDVYLANYNTLYAFGGAGNIPNMVIGSEIMLAPFTSNTFEYVASLYSYYDMAKNFMLETCRTKFNPNNKCLSFEGNIPISNGCFAVVDKEIGLDALYADNMFMRYIRAKAVVRLGALMSFVTKFPMPGGITIDYSQILAESNKEIEQVMKDMEGQNIHNYINFTQR